MKILNEKNFIRVSLRKYLNEMVSDITQGIADKYSKKNAIYHCGDDFRIKFDTDFIKGGSRGIHGWGIYFAATPFKASDYGDYMTIVDKSNLKLLSLDDRITDEFISDIEMRLRYDEFAEIRDEIRTNVKYENLRDLDIRDVNGLKGLRDELDRQLIHVKNNREYNEINDILSNINDILDKEKKDNKPQFFLYDLKKNKGESIDNLIMYTFNNRPLGFEKELSLQFKKCGYDGFNYQDYEYVIFNTDNIRILEHIKIR